MVSNIFCSKVLCFVIPFLRPQVCGWGSIRALLVLSSVEFSSTPFTGDQYTVQHILVIYPSQLIKDKTPAKTENVISVWFADALHSRVSNRCTWAACEVSLPVIASRAARCPASTGGQGCSRKPGARQFPKPNLERRILNITITLSVGFTRRHELCTVHVAKSSKTVRYLKGLPICIDFTHRLNMEDNSI